MKFLIMHHGDEATEAATRFANVFDADHQPDLVLMQVFDPDDLRPA